MKGGTALGIWVVASAVLLGCGGGDTTTIIQQPPATTASPTTTTTPQASSYRGIVSCAAGSNRPDHVCIGGDAPAAGFQAFGASNIPYEMCAIPPTKGLDQCLQGTTGADGERSYLPINTDEVGEWRVAPHHPMGQMPSLPGGLFPDCRDLTRKFRARYPLSPQPLGGSARAFYGLSFRPLVNNH